MKRIHVAITVDKRIKRIFEALKTVYNVGSRGEVLDKIIEKSSFVTFEYQPVILEDYTITAISLSENSMEYIKKVKPKKVSKNQFIISILMSDYEQEKIIKDNYRKLLSGYNKNNE